MRQSIRLFLVLAMALFTPRTALGDACDPGFAGAPILAVSTLHSETTSDMGIKVQNRFAGVYAIVVSLEGGPLGLGTRNELVVIAEKSGAGKEVVRQLKALSPQATMSMSVPDLAIDFSHRFDAPADPDAFVIVRLMFEDGTTKAYQVCTAGSSASLTITRREPQAGLFLDPSSDVAGRAGERGSRGGPDHLRMASDNCECVRLTCGTCYVEKECCGFYAPCTCCSCSSSGGCQITCPPCDWL